MNQCLNKKIIAKNFNQAANHYVQHTPLQSMIANELFTDIKKQAINLNSALDLGCGPGYLSQKLCQHYPKAYILAQDIALNMLLHYQQNHQTNEVLFCNDFESLAIQSECLDLVSASMSLQWANHLLNLLKEIFRTLKAQGQLFFSLPGENTLKELRHCWQQIDKQKHINTFADKKTIFHLLTKAGFRQINIWQKSYVLYYPSAMALCQHLKKTGCSHHARLSQQILKKHFIALENHYQSFRQPQHQLPASYVIYFIQAQK